MNEADKAQQENFTDFKLIVSYIINNVSWTPKYDIRADSENNSVEVTETNK